MKTKIDLVHGPEFDRIVLQNEVLRVVIFPELGAKIASLVNLQTGRAFFLQHPDRPYRRASYAAPFGDYDISGYDECFPTISECAYPEAPFSGTKMPDHGEVWAMPWPHEIRGEELTLAVKGVCLPYILKRKTRLNGSTVELDYELTNTGDKAFKFMWSAHPLLVVEPGTEIVLPPSVDEVLVDYSANNHLTVGKTAKWPGDTTGLNRISGPQNKTADKVFTPRMTEGYCGLKFPRSSEKIFFRFDPAEIPFVGLWICQGGFPVEGTPEFTVAIEPCNAKPDSLEKAIANGECPEIPARGTQKWSLRIEI